MRLISVADGLWVTTCDTHGGGSGGPMFVTQGDQTFVAAVMVGSIQRTASLAVPVSAWKDLPQQGECP